MSPAVNYADEGRPPLVGLRIVAVLCGFDLGGSERQAILLARELAARGAAVEVWGLFDPDRGAASALCDSYGVPWRALGLEWDRGLAREARTLVRLIWALRRAKANVILPYTIYPNVLCGSIWRLTGASLCVWNQRDEGVYRMPERLERWAVRQTPLFVSNSGHGAAFLAQSLGVDQAIIRTIRNAVELDPPLVDRQTWRRRLGMRSETVVACMVANLRRHKDHETLLRAWRQVVESTAGRLSLALLLAGRHDETAQAVEAVVHDLGLRESVQILDHVGDITGLLQASDLFVFSSHSEGLPNAVLEAMAAGLPVVATDLPGIRDALGGEGHGDLCPPRNSDALARRILEMVENPDTRAMAGERNRCRAAAAFGVPQMVGAMAEAIQAALQTRT